MTILISSPRRRVLRTRRSRPPAAACTSSIGQRYQMLEVDARAGGRELLVRNSRLRGEEVKLVVTGLVGERAWHHYFIGSARGDRIDGEVTRVRWQQQGVSMVARDKCRAQAAACRWATASFLTAGMVIGALHLQGAFDRGGRDVRRRRHSSRSGSSAAWSRCAARWSTPSSPRHPDTGGEYVFLARGSAGASASSSRGRA